MIPCYYCLFWKILFCVIDNITSSYPLFYILSPNNSQYHSGHYLYLLISQYDWSIYDLVVVMYIPIWIWCDFWNVCMSSPVWGLLVYIQWPWYIFINVTTLTISPAIMYSIWLTVSDILKQLYQYNFLFWNHIANYIWYPMVAHFNVSSGSLCRSYVINSLKMHFC